LTLYSNRQGQRSGSWLVQSLGRHGSVAVQTWDRYCGVAASIPLAAVKGFPWLFGKILKLRRLATSG